ncbi:hypothetical protein OKW27_007752 [Paraburkholderia sp. 35.1]
MIEVRPTGATPPRHCGHFNCASPVERCGKTAAVIRSALGGIGQVRKDPFRRSQNHLSFFDKGILENPDRRGIGEVGGTVYHVDCTEAGLRHRQLESKMQSVQRGGASVQREQDPAR